MIFFTFALFFLAGEEDLAMPDVATDEAMMDPVEAPEDEPRVSGVIPESPTWSRSTAFFLSFFFFLVCDLVC